MQRKAFTLIELLIVVAIIAILAAIAIPNFLEAQTRAKVSRSKADLRTLSTGLEAYAVDYQKYPPSFAFKFLFRAEQLEKTLFRITTPVAYMTTVSLPDPFGLSLNSQDLQHVRPIYMYTNYEVQAPGVLGDASDPGSVEWSGLVVSTLPGGAAAYSHRAYALTSAGPDTNDDFLYYADYANPSTGIMPDPETRHIVEKAYDPTNGTTSHGDIPRFGGALRIGGISSIN